MVPHRSGVLPFPIATPARRRIVAAIALVAALAGTLVAAADGQAAMRSTKLGPGLCETVGGGKFVDIPGFPGEQIDRRLLRDIRWMRRNYAIFVTDGYSTAPYHAANGEHPIGLALDIVPDRARGGTWRKITRLAKLAEPRQNRPRPPWRWVGYDGDAGHGRRDHLHLSYMHSDTEPKVPARTVYTFRCPKQRDGRRKGYFIGQPAPASGGIRAAALGSRGAIDPLAPPIVERDGTDLAAAR